MYKRTHRGDPNKAGVFGIHDCMGRVRRQGFDAVIGVGGKSPWRGNEGIAGKINWIGINPRKTPGPAGWKGPYVSFEYFILYDENGPQLKVLAPKLFKYMFQDQQVRHVMSHSLDHDIQEEVRKILSWAERNQTTEGSLWRETRKACSDENQPKQSLTRKC